MLHFPYTCTHNPETFKFPSSSSNLPPQRLPTWGFLTSFLPSSGPLQPIHIAIPKRPSFAIQVWADCWVLTGSSSPVLCDAFLHLFSFSTGLCINYTTLHYYAIFTWAWCLRMENKFLLKWVIRFKVQRDVEFLDIFLFSAQWHCDIRNGSTGHFFHLFLYVFSASEKKPQV